MKSADMTRMFGKWSWQPLEIFLESIENILHSKIHLITDAIGGDYISGEVEKYAGKWFTKCKAMSNVVNFIDGTVISVARPKENLPQRIIYNGQKCKHALSYQALSTLDGLIFHIAGRKEG